MYFSTWSPATRIRRSRSYKTVSLGERPGRKPTSSNEQLTTREYEILVLAAKA
jgi:hypothetical protein